MWEKRLEMLERECALWRRITWMLLVLSGAAIASRIGTFLSVSDAAHAAEVTAANAEIFATLKCKEFQLVDNNGKVIGRIGQSVGFMPSIELFSSVTGETLLNINAAPSDLGAAMMMTGEKEVLSISSAGITLRRRDKDAERKLNQMIAAGSQLPVDQRSIHDEKTMQFLKQLYEGGLILNLGSTDQRGGLIEIGNPFGAKVVSVQCNKTNQGAVYVNDVDGKTSRSLIAQ